MPKVRYNNVAATDIGRTIVVSVAQTMFDVSGKSNLLSVESSVPVSKTAGFQFIDVFVSANNPFTFDGFNGLVSLSSNESFRVITVDKDTAESVTFLVDKIMVVVGSSNNVYTVQTDSEHMVKVQVVRAGDFNSV